MEIAGAFGSVLQIAQVGVQLSLNLFKISPNVGSAHRDVQYFAKDIALFSTVLKDLGDRLSRGQTSNLYRDDAYKAGFGIAKECKEIFEEIQSNLDKFNKTGVATPGIFRKSRVLLLRGKLGFLESKILLQVAVLSYAEKASASSNSAADIDGLFALKSLVLANETTKAAFQELFTKSTEGSSSRNPIPISDDRNSRTPQLNSTHSSATAAPTFLSIAEILHESESTFPQSRAAKALPVFGNKPTLPTYSPSPSKRKNYANVWSTIDRLELALRKVETAQWEQERLQTILESNVIRENSKPLDWTEKEKSYLSKFRKSLIHFGLKKKKIDQAIASVMTPHPNAGMRTEVEQVVSQNDVLFATLYHFGAPWQNDENNDDFRIKRWIPDYLEDILWEKIYETFETAADSEPSGSYINTADSMIISDSEEKSFAQKHQAIREAIDKVNQSSMAIDRLDAPQNVHHVRRFAPQSQLRQPYLTVPASEPMPRRATLAMNPPPKSSSYSFSPRESRTSDASSGATKPTMQMDGPRSLRERPTTSMAPTRPPTLIIVGDEDAPDRVNRCMPTENTQRSSHNANPLRYGGVHSSSDRHDISASTRTHGTNDHHQYDPPTGSTPFLLPSPSLKRRIPKEEESITSSPTPQQPDGSLPQTTSIQDSRQWFETEKHDKTSQTVRQLLKRWTFLDLGDEDDDETRDDPYREQGDDEGRTRAGRARIGAGGAEGEHRRGGDGGGGGDGGERGGDTDEGGPLKRIKVRRS